MDDRNHDGFYDDDMNRDGHHDDDFDRDGHHDFEGCDMGHDDEADDCPGPGMHRTPMRTPGPQVTPTADLHMAAARGTR
jgi:hypothetical protein